MTAAELLGLLTTKGVSLERSGKRVIVTTPVVPRVLAEVARLESELWVLLKQRDDEWARNCARSHADYLSSLARTYGYTETTIRRALEWLDVRRPGGEFRITKYRIEIELAGGVTAIFRAPTKFTCPSYYPTDSGKQCVSYVAGGGCSLMESKCVEWLKVNER